MAGRRSDTPGGFAGPGYEALQKHCHGERNNNEALIVRFNDRLVYCLRVVGPATVLLPPGPLLPVPPANPVAGAAGAAAGLGTHDRPGRTREEREGERGGRVRYSRHTPWCCVQWSAGCTPLMVGGAQLAKLL